MEIIQLKKDGNSNIIISKFKENISGLPNNINPTTICIMRNFRKIRCYTLKEIISKNVPESVDRSCSSQIYVKVMK